uniref:leptin receptor isoform X2 n=1 Tax=Gasterosteus aculeatus aculeatus TaxID=481459 RepID=UPI001A989C7C|nr:leptin receptor isoform X2 [Gasterosteus aculeatus aculeatus]
MRIGTLKQDKLPGTMVQSVVLTVVMHILLLSNGARCLEPEEGASLPSGALQLPWQDELCCDSPSAHLPADGDITHAPHSRLSLCSFRGSTNGSNTRTCLDVLCKIDENWENVTCLLQPLTVDAGPLAVSLQWLVSQKEDSDVNNGNTAPIVCKASSSFMCSLALEAATNLVAVMSISISYANAPPVLLRIPDRPVKPSPPFNLSHIQTIEAELIVHWEDPSDSIGPLRYEVRHSSNTIHPEWEVVSAAEPRLPLELKPGLTYTIQVRCSSLDEPPLWSDWSKPHNIKLDKLSYIPEKVVTRPGENVTVYCIFNDHSTNASMAHWELNWKQLLHRSLYHPVNQWVSQITIRSSETRMYDILRCTQWPIHPYSQIYVEGAPIDINCSTNGDIDAMDCSWNITQWTISQIGYRWADLPCDIMEERETAGEELGQKGPACLRVRPKVKTCTIQPLRMSCYKLWVEMSSELGPIKTKPIYLSPIDHVKPHAPTNVRAVTQSNGVLRVTWEPPSLPAEGLQCQLRHYSPSAVKAQPEWKTQRPVQVPRMELAASDMCRLYVVQARCMHFNGKGYWSEWSDPVYSTPQNSRAPKRGPDFWRVLQHDPHSNQTIVTLLFEHLHTAGRSFCIDGFIVQFQASSGSVIREKIDAASSYSFQWDQELQIVTVEAYNHLGSSTSNINMTLETQPKRRAVRSFTVSLINSTCVSLSWSLLDNSSVPLFMVVQWSPQRQEDSDHHKDRSDKTWVRLPYTDSPIHLRGDFLGCEQCGFYLYPVFADREGVPMFALATRRDPAAYIMLMMISFLSLVLVVTLIVSQKQMKKLVWKDVPNPEKCSWAKGLDLKKADTFDQFFLLPEGRPLTWHLDLPSENISNCNVEGNQSQAMESGGLLVGAPSYLNVLVSSSQPVDQLQLQHPPADLPPDLNDSAAQSAVTYATVLICDLKREQPPLHLHDKDWSGGGNFSSNSNISGFFPGGLWELDCRPAGETNAPRRSCSDNSMEEPSKTSEQEDEEEKAREEKDLCCLTDYPAADEGSREEKTNIKLLKNVDFNREEESEDSHALLGPEDSSEPLSASTQSVPLLYLPQLRSAPCTMHLTARP